MAQPPEPALAATPTPGQLFLVFAKIGLTSVGGGLSGWMLREFVQRRHWLSEEAFMNGLAISQALPGVNVVNLAVWIGYQLRGGRGALFSALGMIVPPMIVAILILISFEQMSRYPWVQVMFTGVAAGAVGLSLNMGFRALRRIMRQVVPVLFAAATFAAIFIFEAPLYVVVLTLAPLSIAYSWWRLAAGSAA